MEWEVEDKSKQLRNLKALINLEGDSAGEEDSEINSLPFIAECQ